MELQCPGCQKKLAIADQHAGQMIKCPACGGMFMAPALPSMPNVASAVPATMPAAEPPPSSPPNAPPMPSAASETPGTIPFAPAPPPPPPHPDILTPPPPPPPPLPPISQAPSEPEIALEPGDYTRTRVLHLCPDTVQWIAPACTAILFFLSFGTWLGLKNLWGAAFEPADTALIFYVLLTIFLGLPLAWLKLAFEKGWIPKQDFLKPIWPWRSLIVAGVLGLSFLILAVLWVMGNIGSGVHISAIVPPGEGAPFVPPTVVLTTMAISMKLAVRVHLIAVLGALADYWLEQRRKKRLPLPEATFRW
jgi:hypothetical protein